MEIGKKIEELGTSFEEYKKTNDKRLEEIKAKGQASAETEAKLAKIEKDVDGYSAKLQELNAAIARTGGINGGPVKDEVKEKLEDYRKAQRQFYKKGTPIPSELVNFRYAMELERVSGEKMDAKTTALSVDSEADGGFLVLPETSSEIVKKVFESSPVRQVASVQTISTASLRINQDLDQVASGWVDERASRGQQSTPQVKMDEIFCHELYTNPYATQAFLDDAAVNVESWLSEKVSDRFARDEATAFMTGSGVGQPMGILTYASGTSFGQVERTTSATSSTILAEDLIDAQTALKEPYQNNATWFINRAVIGTIRKLKDTVTGQYIWQPGLLVGKPSVLLGQPVMMAADLPASYVAATDIIIYGDFKAGYQIVDRMGIRVLRDPYSAKPYVTFYTTKRVGGGVKNYEAIKIIRQHS